MRAPGDEVQRDENQRDRDYADSGIEKRLELFLFHESRLAFLSGAMRANNHARGEK